MKPLPTLILSLIVSVGILGCKSTARKTIPIDPTWIAEHGEIDYYEINTEQVENHQYNFTMQSSKQMAEVEKRGGLIIEYLKLINQIDSLEIRFQTLKSKYYETGEERYRTAALANEPLRIKLVKRYYKVRKLMTK